MTDYIHTLENENESLRREVASLHEAIEKLFVKIEDKDREVTLAQTEMEMYASNWENAKCEIRSLEKANDKLKKVCNGKPVSISTRI